MLEKFRDTTWWLWVIPLGFLLAGIVTLSDYGINWDSPVHFLRGQAYLHFFLTGRLTYGEPPRLSPILITPDEYLTRYDFLAAEGEHIASLPDRPFTQSALSSGRVSFYQHEAWNGEFFIKNSGGGHPPFFDILAAFSNRLIWGRLGIIGDIESYHIPVLLVSAIGIFLVSFFTLEITKSQFAAVISGLSLALFPVFFAESHFNLKDPAQAVFYTGAVWAFWNWVGDRRWRWFFALTLCITLAFSVKWNIIFLPFILLLWLFSMRNTPTLRRWYSPKELAVCVSVVVVFAWLVLLAAWPTAWSHPLRAVRWMIEYYWQTGTRTGRLQPDGWILPLGFNAYPLVLLLTQTPTVILLFASIALLAVIRNRDGTKLKGGWLLVFWLLVPIVRFVLPGTYFYSGIRQIFEVIPAMAILAGLGVTIAIRSLTNLTHFSDSKLKWCFLFFVFCFLVSPILHLHPNENTYFNILAGGLPGALKKNLVDWTLTYGNIYRQGANWLNVNAPFDANLAIVNGSQFAISPLWLRPDISISPNHFSGFEQKGEYLLMLYDLYNPAVFAKRYPERFLTPIHTIDVDGVPLLSIYKNDPGFVSPTWGVEEEVAEARSRRLHTAKGDVVAIDLGKTRRVTRISTALFPECVEHFSSPFTDEVVQFIDEKGMAVKDNIYGVNERRKIGSTVEFWFAGEPARKIDIHIQSLQSCFARNDATGVMAFSE